MSSGGKLPAAATEYCVLMTACVDPRKGKFRIERNDPAVRMQDYVRGLRFWLGLDDSRLRKIVFVENSGHDLKVLRDEVAAFNPMQRQVEFICLEDNFYPEGVHYGYAELAMIDHALATSTLLATATHFVKASGRLSFPGIGRLIDRLPPDCAFAVDSRNSSVLSRLPQKFVSTQLMIFSTAFYRRYLVGAKELLHKGLIRHIEHLFYFRLLPFKGQAGAMLRWPVNVAPRGVAAHWQKDYGSPKQRAINVCRAVCRIVFPNWWI
jgi:hypothetical protein